MATFDTMIKLYAELLDDLHSIDPLNPPDRGIVEWIERRANFLEEISTAVTDLLTETKTSHGIIPDSP